MTRVGVHLIFGSNPEPFLEAALRSVDWTDYVAAVNTAPGAQIAQENERTVRAIVPEDKLRLAPYPPIPFSFAAARNNCLSLTDDGDYVLIVDSDDVHWPELQRHAQIAIALKRDVVSAHYWHHAVYKDLLHSMRHREILFLKTPETRFDRGVHEMLAHPRENPALLQDYVYHHYGYIKPAREVAARWEFYRSLGSGVHEYDISQPDRALDDWPAVCKPFVKAHPPAVSGLLESYPSAPKGLKCAAA